MNRILLGLLCVFSAVPVFGAEQQKTPAPPAEFRFGPLTDLLTDDGPMSFGMVVSADVVSWSTPDAQDLLIARCWQGVFL